MLASHHSVESSTVPPPAAHSIATASRNATADLVPPLRNSSLPLPPPPPRSPPAPPLPPPRSPPPLPTRALPRLRAPPRWLAPRPLAPGGQLELNQIMEKMDEAARLHDEVSTRGRAASALAALSFLFLSFWSPFFQIPMALALFALVYFWYWRKDPNFEELLAQAKQKAQAGLSSVDKNSLLAAMPSVSFGSAQQQCELWKSLFMLWTLSWLLLIFGAVMAILFPPSSTTRLAFLQGIDLLERRFATLSPLTAALATAPPADAAVEAPRPSLPASALTAGVVLLQPSSTANSTANSTASATNATAVGAEMAAPAPEATPLPPGAPAGAMMLVRLRDAVLQAAKFQKWPKAKLWQPPNPKQPPKAPTPPRTGRFQPS